MSSTRGQLVLVAALALALALVALGVAYLQLGYHDDIGAAGHEPTAQLEATLERALDDAAREIPATYGWDERDEAEDAIRTELNDTIETLETSRLEDGHAYAIAPNATHASVWEQAHCPGGPDRQFGDCAVTDAVVLQERGGRATVLAMSFDIVVTTPERELTVTTTIEVQAD